jgi:hypothetical protein
MRATTMGYKKEKKRKVGGKMENEKGVKEYIKITV